MWEGAMTRDFKGHHDKGSIIWNCPGMTQPPVLLKSHTASTCPASVRIPPSFLSLPWHWPCPRHKGRSVEWALQMNNDSRGMVRRPVTLTGAAMILTILVLKKREGLEKTVSHLVSVKANKQNSWQTLNHRVLLNVKFILCTKPPPSFLGSF